MIITINGQPIYLKEGTSFDFVSENRYFTDADEYSLSISVPLAGCSQNISVFGHLTRKDIDNPKSVLNAEIRHHDFLKRGVVTITEITQSDIKLQFLANRTAQNYSSDLDEIYINELDLGEPTSTDPADWTVMRAWGLDSTAENYMKYIAIPWVNNSSGNVQNDVVYDESVAPSFSGYSWHPELKGLSFMPYMKYIAEKICEAVGLTGDFSVWEASAYRYLLCCSALPWAWEMPQFAHALPHWTVRQFFTELENLMQCEFDFDLLDGKVTMSLFSDNAASAGSVQIEDVIDEFSVSVESKLKKSDIDKPQLFKYRDADSKVWNRYTCDWLVNANRNFIIEVTSDLKWNEIVAEYGSPVSLLTRGDQETIDELKSWNPCPYIFHYLNTYFIVEYGDIIKSEFIEDGDYVVDGNTYQNYTRIDTFERKFIPIAMFAPWLSEDDRDAATEINIAPVIIDETDMGDCIFLTCGELSNDGVVIDEGGVEVGKRKFSETIAAGEQSEADEYLSTMETAFAIPEIYLDKIGSYYCPFIDRVHVDNSNLTINYVVGLSKDLRLNQSQRYAADVSFDTIDLEQKYTFKFLSDTMPNVRAIFFIQGKRYVCESITATFSENGVSGLKKGVFYRIADE